MNVPEGKRRLAGPGRSDEQRARSRIKAASEQSVEFGHPAREGLLPKVPMVLGRDQTREDLQAPAPDHEVMVAAPEVHASHLDDPNAPPLRPVRGSKLLKMDDGVTETVQVQVVLVRSQVIEQQNGRVVEQEEVLERKHLATVAQRPLREQADLGEAVEDHPGGAYPLHLGQHHVHGLAEFEIGGVDEALLLLGIEAQLRRNKLVDLQAVQRPAMSAPPRTEARACSRTG